MERIIHPIGQGAFYSEQFDNFTIVYDCGEWKKTRRATHVVEDSFAAGSKIDVLFISHFDFDHVSLISILKQKCQIKTCFLPVINDVEKIIISNIYMAMGQKDLSTFVINPKLFFGSVTKIIYVDPVNNNLIVEDTKIKNDLRITSIDNLRDEEHIASGTELSFSKKDWIYVPYNVEHTERRTELINLLKKQNLIITYFTIEYNDYIEEHIKEIRKSYRLLRGGINSNSMYLYSGPSKQGISGFIESLLFYYKTYLHIEYRTACIYTGDGNLDVIKEIYKKYWVMLVQFSYHIMEVKKTMIILF